MVGSYAPQPPEFSISPLPKPFHLITNATAHFLRRTLLPHRHHFHSPSLLQNFPHLGLVLQLEGTRNGRFHQFKGFNLPQWPCWLLFFGGEANKTNYGDQEKAYLGTPTRNPVNGRRWTNIILAVNVLVYIAQVASQGKVLMWGAKINSLIDKGELWRLVTSTFLHANVGHLMINCYSLNSIGPTMEYLSGPRRYLAIYMTSAIASSSTSYWFSKAPAVGASGAIFGLASTCVLNPHAGYWAFVTRY